MLIETRREAIKLANTNIAGINQIDFPHTTEGNIF